MPLVYPVAAQVKFLTNPLGLYLHIPFCTRKCKYCDFYSSFVTEELLDEYVQALIRSVKQWGGKTNRPIDTLYLGGGTPSLLNHRLKPLLEAVHSSFKVLPDTEITLEINPTPQSEDILQYALAAGINRLSIGVQSGNNNELQLLGRTHTKEDAVNTVKKARKLGFNNISLDIMLALPFSSLETLETSLDFLTELKPEHISAYLLKIEEKTAFYPIRDTLSLPDDDAQANQYLFLCRYLANKGYEHYEISNFCKNGYQSRHNTKYWLGNDYLGIGPSAHSSLDKKRFFYERNLKKFISGTNPISDGPCSTAEEYIMLRLRLNSGISIPEFKEKFTKSLSFDFFEKCKTLEKAKLLVNDNGRIFLTDTGMLLSNTIITELLECLE